MGPTMSEFFSLELLPGVIPWAGTGLSGAVVSGEQAAGQPASARVFDPYGRVFGPDMCACAAARAYVEDLLTAWRMTRLRDEAALAVTELITNVLLHTNGLATLVVRRTRCGVWIGVHDTSDRQPALVPATTTATSGRGMRIIDALADTWGVSPDPHTSGKTVWLQLTAPATEAAAAPASRS